MPSGAQNRAARTAKERREEEARELVPLRVANLTPAERDELLAVLSELFAGQIGDPDE